METRNIAPLLAELKATVTRRNSILNVCLEGRAFSHEIDNVVKHSSSIQEAIYGLEKAWKDHLDLLNSTEEGRKLSRDLCELDSIMADVQLGVGEEGL